MTTKFKLLGAFYLDPQNCVESRRVNVFPLFVPSQAPTIISDPAEVNNQTSAVLSCNLTDTTLVVKGSYWTHNGKVIEASKSTAASHSTVLK